MVAMNISLTPELAKLIHNKVKSGMYSNASEVVREALRSFNIRKESTPYEEKLENLKRTLEIGIGQVMRGEATNVSYQEIIKHLQQMLEQGISEADQGIYAEYSAKKIRSKLNKRNKNA